MGCSCPSPSLLGSQPPRSFVHKTLKIQPRKPSKIQPINPSKTPRYGPENPPKRPNAAHKLLQNTKIQPRRVASVINTKLQPQKGGGGEIKRLSCLGNIVMGREGPASCPYKPCPTGAGEGTRTRARSAMSLAKAQRPKSLAFSPKPTRRE